MTESLYMDKAKYYDLLYKNKDYKGEVEFLLGKISSHDANPTCRALVVGCGTGNHSKFLEEENFEVTGVDPYKGMLEEARKKSNADFKKDSLPRLDSIEGKFDIIFLPYTIVNHIDWPELEKSINRLKELLSEKGLLIFDNMRLPDENTIGPWLETKSNDDIELSRHTQIVKSGENKVDWCSEITVSNGDFFIDRHDIYTHKDVEIAELLQNKGFKFEVNTAGYETDSQKDDGTVFVAQKN